MRLFLLANLMFASISTQAAAEFSFTFEWGSFRRCTSGSPITVANPKFTLSDVPEGTKSIRFRMVDKYVPSYRHGGGVAAHDGASTIEPGAFKYQSPCPPDGPHIYEWTATAKSGADGKGETLGVAKASKSYP